VAFDKDLRLLFGTWRPVPNRLGIGDESRAFWSARGVHDPNFFGAAGGQGLYAQVDPSAPNGPRLARGRELWLERHPGQDPAAAPLGEIQALAVDERTDAANAMREVWLFYPTSPVALVGGAPFDAANGVAAAAPWLGGAPLQVPQVAAQPPVALVGSVVPDPSADRAFYPSGQHPQGRVATQRRRNPATGVLPGGGNGLRAAAPSPVVGAPDPSATPFWDARVAVGMLASQKAMGLRLATELASRTQAENVQSAAAALRGGTAAARQDQAFQLMPTAPLQAWEAGPVAADAGAVGTMVAGQWVGASRGAAAGVALDPANLGAPRDVPATRTAYPTGVPSQAIPRPVPAGPLRVRPPANAFGAETDEARMLHHALFLLNAPDWAWQVRRTFPLNLVCSFKPPPAGGGDALAIPPTGSGLFMRDNGGHVAWPQVRGWATYALGEPIGPFSLDKRFGERPANPPPWAPDGHIPGPRYTPQTATGDSVLHRVWVVRGPNTPAGSWDRFHGLRFYFV